MGLQGLEFQNVDIKFDKGQNTRDSDKLLLPGEWEKLQNYSLSVDGTLRRRDGVATVAGASTANAFVVGGDAVVALSEGSGTAVSIDSTTGNKASAVAGQVPCVQVKSRLIHASGTYVQMIDTATVGDLQLVVWTAILSGGNTKLMGQIRNMATGASVLPDTVIYSGGLGSLVLPRCAAYSGAFFICWSDAIDLKLRACVIDSAAPGVVGAVTVLGTAAYLNNCAHDMCTIPGLGVFVACPWNDGTNSVFWFQLGRSSGTILTSLSASLVTQAALSRGNIIGLGVCAFAGANTGTIQTMLMTTVANGGIRAISWLGGVAGLLFVIDATHAPTGAGLCHITGTATGNNVTAFWDMFGDDTFAATALKSIWSRAITPTATAGSSSAVVNSASFGTAGTDASGAHGPYLFGKPWVTPRGTTCVPVAVYDVASGITHVANDNAQNTLFILDGSTGAVLGHAFHGMVAAYPFAAYPPTANTVPWWPFLCSTPLGWDRPYPGAGGAAFALPVVTRLDLAGGIGLTGSVNIAQPGVATVQFSPNSFRDTWRTKINNEGLCANGALGAFDGASLSMHGFELYPTGVYAAENAAATDSGAIVDAGVHQVVVVYEWIDAAGNRHQSAPSPAVSVTHDGTVDKGIVIKVPTLLLTKKPNVNIVPYVTAKSGTIFYRSLTSIGSGVYPTPNNTAAATVTFTFGDSDALLTAREALYTQPDQGTTPLANTLPAPCTVTCSHGGRIFADISDNPGQIQFSQVAVPGVGIQFNEALRINVDSSGGPINGLVEMDEKLIVLCRDKIFAVYGAGPDQTGTTGGFSPPSEIVSDVGAMDPMAIVKLPHGILFQSGKGFHLLGRDLTVRYVGKGVEAYKYSGPYAGSVVLDDRKEARISLPGVGVLVYSYLSEAWSVYAYAIGASIYPLGWVNAPSDSYGAAWVLAAWGSNGVTYDSGQAVDTIGGSPYTVNVVAQTGWLRTASLNGFQRVRMLYLTGDNGGSPSPMSLLEESSDGVDGGSSSTAAFTPIIDVRHKLVLQKGKSLRLTLSGAGSGFGYRTIQGMTLQVGVKKGVYKAPSANSI